MGRRKRLVLLFELREQPHVLDGDDGLVGEGLEQRDLLVGEGVDFGPADYDHADRYTFAQKRRRQHGAKATTNPWKLRLQPRRDVIDMDRPAFDNGEASRIITADRASRVGQGKGSKPGDKPQRVTLDAADYRVVCSAESSRILGNGIENRLDIGGRLTDDPQNLTRRRLLLQRLAHLRMGLGERSVLLLQFSKEPDVLDGDDRLVGEGLEERDLRVREWLHFGSADDDRTDRYPFAE